MVSWRDHVKRNESIIEEKIGAKKDINRIIANIIKQRNRLKWTQEKLASEANLKQSAIARLETFMVVPRLDTLIKIFKAMGLTLEIVEIESGVDKLQHEDSIASEYFKSTKYNQRHLTLMQNLLSEHPKKREHFSKWVSEFQMYHIDKPTRNKADYSSFRGLANLVNYERRSIDDGSRAIH